MDFLKDEGGQINNIDHGKLSTQVITVVTAISAVVYLYPDAFNYFASQFGIDARVIAGIAQIAALIYNYKNPRSNEDSSTDSSVE
jgi:hypothetical protein